MGHIRYTSRKVGTLLVMRSYAPSIPAFYTRYRAEQLMEVILDDEDTVSVEFVPCSRSALTCECV
jgi:hypothetical protein